MTATIDPTTSPRKGEWPWWLNDLEAAVGPLVAGRVYVIGARPSCGKSALLMNLFTHLSQQLGPGATLLSCWTERSRYASRLSLASLLQGLDEDLVMREKWASLPDGSEQKVRSWVESLERDERWLPMLDGCPSADEIVDALNQYQPKIFLLDYLQNVRPVGRQSIFDAWTAVMGYCTQLAANGGVAIVGSQLKRKMDRAFDKYRPPFMEDFKGGGVIEERANLALGLFRPLKKMTAAEEKEVSQGRNVDLSPWTQPGVMAIKVLKHTFWASAADRIVRVRVHPNRRITDFNYQAPELNLGDAYEGDVPF